MQFGKFSGWALIALGTLLIVVQIVFFLFQNGKQGVPQMFLL
jgi:uncharacterized membrane protein